VIAARNLLSRFAYGKLKKSWKYDLILKSCTSTFGVAQKKTLGEHESSVQSCSEIGSGCRKEFEIV